MNLDMKIFYSYGFHIEVKISKVRIFKTRWKKMETIPP